MFYFRNDYTFGAPQQVMDAIAAVNFNGYPGYGEDDLTAKAKAIIRDLCQTPDAAVEFTVAGTQTNVLACAFFLKPWEAAVCAVSGHLNGHEAGAFEATGHKIIPVETAADGKLTPALLAPVLEAYDNPHLVKPALVYISDATENGTVYTKAELTALSGFCREHRLTLFADGARLACALTSDANDLTLPEFARLVDAFYIGGTKNGALFGEALVIRDGSRAEEFFRMKKRLGTVIEKGWLQGVMFDTLLRDGLWFDMGRHANVMAARLQDGLRRIGWKIWVESTTNQIFAVVPKRLRPQLDAVCVCDTWCPFDAENDVMRFVTCFRTSEADVDGLLAALESLPYAR